MLAQPTLDASVLRSSPRRPALASARYRAIKRRPERYAIHGGKEAGVGCMDRASRGRCTTVATLLAAACLTVGTLGCGGPPPPGEDETSQFG